MEALLSSAAGVSFAAGVIERAHEADIEAAVISPALPKDSTLTKSLKL